MAMVTFPFSSFGTEFCPALVTFPYLFLHLGAESLSCFTSFISQSGRTSIHHLTKVTRSCRATAWMVFHLMSLSILRTIPHRAHNSYYSAVLMVASWIDSSGRRFSSFLASITMISGSYLETSPMTFTSFNSASSSTLITMHILKLAFEYSLSRVSFNITRTTNPLKITAKVAICCCCSGTYWRGSSIVCLIRTLWVG